MICLVNPQARSGRGRKRQAYWRQELAGRARWHECLSGDDCRRQAALAEETVVAVGGDGTINNVINGLMTKTSPPPMGVLYSGTSPDFCAFHHIPTQPAAALAALLSGKVKLIDTAAIDFHDHALEQQAFFACSCNIGLGADTAAFANTWRKYWGDLAGTGFGLLRAITSNRPFAAEVGIDGKSLHFARCNHIIVLKNPHIASSLRLNLPCQADDGLLRLVVIHDHSPLELLPVVAALYRGTVPPGKNIFAAAGQTVTVSAMPPQRLEFDGDPRGWTPAAITIKPRALPLLCGSGHD